VDPTKVHDIFIFIHTSEIYLLPMTGVAEALRMSEDIIDVKLQPLERIDWRI
jgi:hypothetical protein